MLPHILSEQLCSLNPRVDRLAYSAFFRLDLKTGQLVPEHTPELKRSVIRSCAKWNYDLAQKIIDEKLTSEDQLEDEMKPADGHSFLDLAQDVLRLDQLAQVRRKKRLNDGSLVFEKEDFNFVLNEETQHPIVYKESPPMRSKELVEEYMLTANVLVAEFLFKHCEDKTLLRAHADIPEHKKANMRQLLSAIGLGQVNLADSLSLAQSLELVKEQTSSASERSDKLTVIQRHMFRNLNIA
jgi:exoribonuclease R